MSRRVLMTGGSGFVGRRLASAMRARGWDVATPSRQDWDLTRGELPDVAADHVVHLAARTFVPDSWKQPRDFYEANVLGTVTVLEYCRRNEASLTLVSSYVYGRPEKLPISEDHPLSPFNPYSHSKILAEEAARFYGSSFRIPVSIVRPFNLYGPGQAGHFLIPTLLRQALSREETITVADTRPKRDYLFVDDFVDLLVEVAVGGGDGVFNAGSGYSVGIAELVEIINRLLPSPKELVSRQESRPEEILDVAADIGKARRAFRWAPRTSLQQGIEKTLDALRKTAIALA
jgi:nucleoside-diphosphate-sugar epimerase